MDAGMVNEGSDDAAELIELKMNGEDYVWTWRRIEMARTHL